MNVCILALCNECLRIIPMDAPSPDFEVSIRGHRLLCVKNGILNVNGKDYYRDLADLSAVVSTLSHVIGIAASTQRKDP